MSALGLGFLGRRGVVSILLNRMNHPKLVPCQFYQDFPQLIIVAREATRFLLLSTTIPEPGMRPYLDNEPLHDAEVVEDGHHTTEENNDGQSLQARHQGAGLKES